MGPTLILAVAMALPMGGGHGHACQTCNQCDNCGHHGFLHKGGFWARRGLPAPCHAPAPLAVRVHAKRRDLAALRVRGRAVGAAAVAALLGRTAYPTAALDIAAPRL